MKTGTRSTGFSVALATLVLAMLAWTASGCLERKLKPLNPCLVSGVVAKIQVTKVDKVDLLFMVDNPGSMREELTSTITDGQPNGSAICVNPTCGEL